MEGEAPVILSMSLPSLPRHARLTMSHQPHSVSRLISKLSNLNESKYDSMLSYVKSKKPRMVHFQECVVPLSLVGVDS